jgi:hypothetical protein
MKPAFRILVSAPLLAAPAQHLLAAGHCIAPHRQGMVSKTRGLVYCRMGWWWQGDMAREEFPATSHRTQQGDWCLVLVVP